MCFFCDFLKAHTVKTVLSFAFKPANCRICIGKSSSFIYFTCMTSSIIKACDCACYLAKNIRRMEGEIPSAQRIHNLLYLAFRESASLFSQPVFGCTFRYNAKGVVCENCSKTNMAAARWMPKAACLSKNVLMVLNSILGAYGTWSEEALSRLIMNEESWKDAKLQSGDCGHAVLSEDLILEDSCKIDRLKALWNMSHSTYDPGQYEDLDPAVCCCFAADCAQMA